MKLKKDIGNRIKLVRSKLQMTQDQLAKDINMSIASVSGYELGDTFPNIEAAIKICAIGKVSLTWLFTGESNEIHEPPEECLTLEEKRLIEAFSKMDHKNQAALLRIAEAIVKT